MGVADHLDNAWHAFKARAKNVLIVSTLVLALFSLFFMIAGGYVGATFTSPTEQGAAIAAGVAGALLLLLSVLGLLAVRYRSKRLSLAHLVFTILMFLLQLALLVYLLSYFRKFHAVGEATTSLQITDSTTQSVNDWVMSLYTYCCTGCTVAVCGKSIPSTEFCDQTQPRCAWAEVCPTSSANPNLFCFFNSDVDGTTPPIDVGEGMCTLFKNAPWGKYNFPVVGHVGGNPLSGVSCGGGDPKVFAQSVSQYLFDQYGWLSAIVGIVLFVEIIAGLASLAMYKHLGEQVAPREKQQLRPWA